MGEHDLYDDYCGKGLTQTTIADHIDLNEYNTRTLVKQADGISSHGIKVM